MHKGGPGLPEPPLCRYAELEAMRAVTGRLDRNWLERPDLLSLGALGALTGGELDSLVFLQAAESVNLNRGVVHEDVGAAVVGGDEPVALVGVEPLHGALRHVPSPTG